MVTHADQRELAYAVLVKLARLLGSMPPLESIHDSRLAVDDVEILQPILHFLGVDGIELQEEIDPSGDAIYSRAAQLVRRANLCSAPGRLRLPVVEMPGSTLRLVFMDARVLQALSPLELTAPEGATP